MRNLPNVEKSAFEKGRYVGYANGFVYKIIRRGNWFAICNNPTLPAAMPMSFDAPTLDAISARLTSLVPAN